MTAKERLKSLLEMLPDPPRLAPVLNRQIDRMFHPNGKAPTPLHLLADTLAHFVVEQMDAVARSAAKAVRYNLPRLLEMLEERG